MGKRRRSIFLFVFFSKAANSSSDICWSDSGSCKFLSKTTFQLQHFSLLPLQDPPHRRLQSCPPCYSYSHSYWNRSKSQNEGFLSQLRCRLKKRHNWTSGGFYTRGTMRRLSGSISWGLTILIGNAIPECMVTPHVKPHPPLLRCPAAGHLAFFSAGAQRESQITVHKSCTRAKKQKRSPTSTCMRNKYSGVHWSEFLCLTYCPAKFWPFAIFLARRCVNIVLCIARASHLQNFN